jgi:hypothetical protein
VRIIHHTVIFLRRQERFLSIIGDIHFLKLIGRMSTVAEARAINHGEDQVAVASTSHEKSDQQQQQQHKEKNAPQNEEEHETMEEEDRKMPAKEKNPSQSNDENSRPFDPDQAGEELPSPVGDDLVLVAVDPRLSAPSVGVMGSRTNTQIERRKRLFAAKTIFVNPNLVLPRRQKMGKQIGRER